ncbi:histidine kinase/DNA gyrase B/HSP90-like ATPase [Chitinophaga skermanii]|uniref:Histidine kinase/DNA gyrase B/HSP90-like ATPase n=1 Tax=Chitinophaga skermanii TaxID=331697 RepID=A0A327PZM9_9BACT|nr:ATP-binding protein [Chitinophaga skermanii]RAI97695.1 histidine kinase/DNA gyrase B/HSP90-like ATPase [Chitinophaga skermanii]
MLPQNSTNLKNRVNKLYLPRTKPLLPLFEVISNSIHAINDKAHTLDRPYDGKIEIEILRNGNIQALASLPEINNYPIHSFKVTDNGIGFNAENIKAFAECDTDRKAAIGGKGVGRLVCLKAFERIKVESVYLDNDMFKARKFEYKKSKDGFNDYLEGLETDKTGTETIVTLSKYELEFQKNVPTNIYEIAQEIVNHFQLYFIQGLAPDIIILNQNRTSINLKTLFETDFAKDILSGEFTLANETFKTIISKSYNAKSHKFLYCAHQRIVKEEGVSKYIEDLKYKIVTTDIQQTFYYQIFIVGDFLDNNVNEERTNFNFKADDEDETLDIKEITLAKIRKGAITLVEDILSEFLKQARVEKLAKYIPIIETEFPNYFAVINHNKEKVERLPAGLSKSELDLKLYEIESDWRINVKKDGVELLKKKKDITNLDEYKELYEKFLGEFNEIGQSDLARYVVHRRAVIDLLDQLIELNSKDKFAHEDIVHSLFFPIREFKSTVPFEKQNLWLLDERLTFNTLLASDKLFSKINDIDSQSSDRSDLLIRVEEVFDDAVLYSEEKIPFESFTIVEFKRPERDDYVHGDKKKDPIKQVRCYIEEIINNKVKVRGKSLGASVSTPFYCYIVADITDSLKSILVYEGFDSTPDGLGYFKFFNINHSRAYIEVLPFKKVIKDAKQRNKILFDKLKLS